MPRDDEGTEGLDAEATDPDGDERARRAQEPTGGIPRGWASMDAISKVTATQGMSVRALRDLFLETTGEAAPDDRGDREWLRLMVAYAIDRKEHGLSETAELRLASLAAAGPHGPGARYVPIDRGWRRVDGGTTGRTAAPKGTAPKAPAKAEAPDRRLPAPGAEMRATYKGREIKATMLEGGRVKVGRETFPSVSAAAKSVTGKPTSGYAFFKLG